MKQKESVHSSKLEGFLYWPFSWMINAKTWKPVGGYRKKIREKRKTV